MTEKVLKLLAAMGADTSQEELLTPLCQAVQDSLARRLRPGVTAEDCESAFVTAAAQFLLASRIHNFATPVALGVLGGVTGLMAANTRAGIFWPWSQMLLGMNSNRSEDVLGGESGLFFIICALYLVLLCWTGIYVCRGTRRKARKADD